MSAETSTTLNRCTVAATSPGSAGQSFTFDPVTSTAVITFVLVPTIAWHLIHRCSLSSRPYLWSYQRVRARREATRVDGEPALHRLERGGTLLHQCRQQRRDVLPVDETEHAGEVWGMVDEPLRRALADVRRGAAPAHADVDLHRGRVRESARGSRGRPRPCGGYAMPSQSARSRVPTCSFSDV